MLFTYSTNKTILSNILSFQYVNTEWNDKIVILKKKKTLQLYFKSFIEKNQFR